jgi:hypothetical protein
MTVTPNQPTLPIEGQFTEAELVFVDESPPGLFPENQDSNFGFIIRKIFSDRSQDVANWQDIIYNEHFVLTSERFLDQWEIEVGLPPNPVGVPFANRKAAVLSRTRRGPFTRTRRNDIIQGFIKTTFGNPIQLVPQGLPLDVGGLPIYGESGIISGLWDVIEYPTTFSYVVWIQASNSPNIPALTRELKRITPAGISFTITNTHP